jgi:hypothetical protein
MEDDTFTRAKLGLLEYLTYLNKGHPLTPDELIVPQRLVARMGRLYVDSDEKSVEHGFQLMFDSGTGDFSTGEVHEGTRGSVNVGPADPKSFGDAHGHPTTPFGYVGGFPAHSPQDIIDLVSTVGTRPYFFKFVACGPWIYAMVQITGWSVRERGGSPVSTGPPEN